MNLNSAYDVWLHVENTFWWWWGPVLAIVAVTSYYMIQLSAAQTLSGTIARIAMLLGNLLLVASFGYDFCGFGRGGLTRVGVLSIMFAMLLMVRQFALACRAQRRFRPVDDRFGKRVLAALVEDHA